MQPLGRAEVVSGYPGAGLNVPPGALLVVDVGSLSLAANLVVTFSVLRSSGVIERVRRTYVPTGAVPVRNSEQVVPEGILLHLSCLADGSTGGMGDMFARVSLGLPSSGAVLDYVFLVEGFVGESVGPLWPWSATGTLNWDAIDPQLTTVADPAAGADWSVALNGEVWDQILSVTARLSTSAVAGNRRVTLALIAGGIRFWQFPCANVQAASTVVTHVWSRQGTVEVLTAGVNNLPLGRLGLGSGESIASATTLIDAGDQWDRIRISSRRRVLVG